MDRGSKKVLKYLNQFDGCNHVFDFGELDNVAGSLNIPTEDLRANIRYLEECGYVDYNRSNSGHVFSFSLSHLGRHYREFSWEALKLFCIKSVLVPIGVAIITSLIVNFLTLH